MSQEEHKERAIHANDRPPTKREWKPAVAKLLEKCWKRNPGERINAPDLYKQLREQVDIYYEEGFETVDEAGLERKLCI
jgi:hypothetical protein